MEVLVKFNAQGKRAFGGALDAQFRGVPEEAERVLGGLPYWYWCAQAVCPRCSPLGQGGKVA